MENIVMHNNEILMQSYENLIYSFQTDHNQDSIRKIKIPYVNSRNGIIKSRSE
jgi:hypothetical protein